LGHRKSEKIMPRGIYIRSEAQKEKQRQAGFKRVQTDATKEKCRLANVGKIVSEETREKQRKFRMGKTASEETKEKYRKRKQELANDPTYRKRLSDGVRKALAENPDINKKRSEYSLQRWQDPEFRARMSVTHMASWDKNYDRKMRRVELNVGGFWYGNVRYNEGPQYCELWNANLRERCRAYFDYTCVECGTPQNGRKLGVHHVHYNKKSCCDGSPRDLVPLCVDCHGATNHNRGYWEKHFTEMLHSYYGGKSFFTKEEYAAYKNS
jgi:hypothetical protein